MKRVTRVLSVLFALVLFAGLLSPAVNAYAAAAPKMNKSSRTLYVGGSKVEASSYKGTYTLKVNNKPSKYTATWTSSNPEVAKVVKKTKGRAKVTALSVGKTTITCKFTDKATGKVYTLTSKITVKNNATSVAIGKKNLPESLSVGTKMQLSSLMYDENGKAGDRGVYVTDYRMWTSSDEKVATVTKKGLVTAVGAGEATITCYTYQSSGLKAFKHATASDTVTIKVVAAGLSSVQQKSLNTFTAQFDSDMKSVVTKDNLVVSKVMNAGSASAQTVKSVTFDSTGKTATVTMYANFEDGVEYSVKYGETTKSFNASVGDIASISIYTADGNNTAVAGKNQQLYFKFFNSKGIDITPVNETSYSKLLQDITIDKEGNDCLLGTTDKTVFFIETGKTAVISAEYHTYKYDSSNKEIVFKANVLITSINEASTITVDDWMVTNEATLGADFDWSQKSQKLAADDADYRIVVQASDSDGNDIYSDDASSKFTFKCEKTDTLLIDSTTGVLYPIKTGTADIIVSYNNEVVKVITVTISSKRVATSIVFDKTREDVSNVSGFDKCTFTVTVMDQLGEKIKLKSIDDISVSCANAFYPAVTKTLNSDGTISVSFNGYGYGYGENSGLTYPYVVKYGNCANTFVATIKTPTGSSSYKLDIPATIDIKLTSGISAWPSVPVALYEYKNGVKNSKITGIKTATDVSIVSGDYYYRVVYDGADVNLGTTDNFIPYTTSGTTITKAKTGSYNLMVFQKTSNSAALIASTTFTLKDSSPSVSFVKIADKSTTAISSGMSQEAITQALLSCFTFKIGSTTVLAGNITADASVVGSQAIYIRTAKVTEKVTVAGTEYSIIHNVTVGASITN